LFPEAVGGTVECQLQALALDGARGSLGEIQQAEQQAHEDRDDDAEDGDDLAEIGAVQALNRTHRPGAHRPSQAADAHGVGSEPRHFIRGIVIVVELPGHATNSHSVLGRVQRQCLSNQLGGIDERQEHAIAPLIVACWSTGQEHGARPMTSDFDNAYRCPVGGRASGRFVGEHAHQGGGVHRCGVDSNRLYLVPGRVKPDQPPDTGIVLQNPQSRRSPLA
jgi:hypothetical protein